MFSFKKKNKEKDTDKKKSNKIRTKDLEHIKRDSKKIITKTAEDEVMKENPDIKEDSKEYKKKVKKKVEENLLIHNDTLTRIAPSGNIKFRDIDFISKGRVRTILTFSTRKGNFDQLPPLWGMKLMPQVAGGRAFKEKGITVKPIFSLDRRSNDWADKKLQGASSMSKTGFSESIQADQSKEKNKYKAYFNDTETIADELYQGASYLDLSIRYVVSARNKDDLDEAIYQLEDEFSTSFNRKVELVPFVGEMKKEYANLLDSAKEQKGENYQLTSKELAGSYPFISTNVNDMQGTYIGRLYNPINRDPVLLDTTNIKKLGVIVAKDRAADLYSESEGVYYDYKATTAWSNKITQDALVNGNRVVEYVLNGEHVERMRDELLFDETAYINLTEDDVSINMFEPFAEGRDQISAHHVTVSKIKEAARQYSKPENANDRSTLVSGDMIELEKVIKQFYIDEDMWQENPYENKEDIRFVGLKHNQYPVLSRFIKFLARLLDDEQKKISSQGTTDSAKRLGRLKDVFEKILASDENLFNRQTTIDEDFINSKLKVLFDFKILHETKHEALMAAFVNSLAYGEQTLSEDDVLIIHGADELTESVKEHLRKRIGFLNNRGVKVYLLYNDADVLFEKQNTEDKTKDNIHRIWFRNADMRISNPMRGHNIQEYEEVIQRRLPQSVKTALKEDKNHIYYMNSETKSVLFKLHIMD